MGFFDRFRRGFVKPQSPNIETHDDPKPVAVAASEESNEKSIRSFDNSNITFSGELAGYDYSSILKDKQGHIVDLYRLADYYSDADAIIRGIIRHVYVPYSTCSPWVLSGAKDKTCKIFEEKYKKMRLREKLDGIMLEYWKYGNVFVYYMDGELITLPVHKCKIGNVTLNGTPIVDFDCQSIINEWKQKSYQVKENWIKDNNLDVYFKGYPKEIRDALNKGTQYAQLDPKNVFVLQASKESWQRYAVPFIASCLSALGKKELISQYENAILNLGIRSFVHVKYGDKNKGYDMLPDINQLNAVRNVFSKAMSGFPLAVTNHLADAEIHQPKLDDLFQWDKYREVNNDILSAGGVSGILVSGVSEDGSTFASAQVSMQTAAARIESSRDEFCEMMNRVNERLIEDLSRTTKYNLKEVPKFSFMPLDMSGKKALREACTQLWEKGLVSTKTMMDTQGYSIDIEKEKRMNESSDGTDKILIPRETMNAFLVKDNDTEEDNDRGRPKMNDEERHSDPDAAERGKQPKPSNPEGSKSDEGIS